MDNIKEKTMPTDTHSSLTKEDESNLGSIKINHSVIASIVRLAALEIEGCYSVGGNFVTGIAEIFSKKESDRGVRVNENENGEYDIELRVILRFGVELAKTAMQIQENIKEQVHRMTMKDVANIDIIIDGVKTGDDEQSNSSNKDSWVPSP